MVPFFCANMVQSLQVLELVEVKGHMLLKLQLQVLHNSVLQQQLKQIPKGDTYG